MAHRRSGQLSVCQAVDRLADHVRHDLRLRNHDHVRSLDLGDLRACALGHGPDDVAARGLVAGRDDGPGRQLSPGRSPVGSVNAAAATGRWVAAMTAACARVGRRRRPRGMAGSMANSRGLRALPGRVLQLEQRRIEDAVLGVPFDVAEDLALFRGEGGDVDQADDVAGVSAALVMIAPP